MLLTAAVQSEEASLAPYRIPAPNLAKRIRLASLIQTLYALFDFIAQRQHYSTVNKLATSQVSTEDVRELDKHTETIDQAKADRSAWLCKAAALGLTIVAELAH